MNCQEARKLFEDALDRRMSSGVKRRFDLHLTRCRACRTLYEAEHAEHARWFRALNAAERPHALPSDFADRLVAAVVANEAMDNASFFRRLRLPRWLRRAACFAVLLFGVAFAATVVVDAITVKEGESSNETNYQPPTTNYQTNGENEMKKGKAVATALALVALGAVSEGQATTLPRTAPSLYKSGCEPTEPAPASSVSSASDASVPLDSRVAQSVTSGAVAFNSDSVPGMMMIIR